MEWLLEVALKYPARFAAVGILLLASIGGFIWYQAVWLSPGKIFEDMLANNLGTMSVTRQVGVSSKAQSIDQTIRLQLGGTNAADWLVTARQSNSGVTTESIATSTSGYLRYLSVNTSGKASAYKPLLNIWAKSDGKTDADLGQLFAETVLDITNLPAPPIGNLPVDERENLLAYNRDNKVFTPDYSKVKQESIDGRSVDTFSVNVQLSAYVGMMQLFAHDLGLTRLDQLDANQYIGAPPVVLNMSVDRMSHQLVRITYPASGFTQTYTDWGLQTDVAIPQPSLSTTELQARLQAAAKK